MPGRTREKSEIGIYHVILRGPTSKKYFMIKRIQRDTLILRIKAIEGILQCQAARILGVAPNLVIRT